jgi:hypothetical protein
MVAVVVVVGGMSVMTMRTGNSGRWTVGMVETAWMVRPMGIVGIVGMESRGGVAGN